MLKDETAVARYTEFVVVAEPRLRRALTAAFGDEVGREATADTLAYGWQHWDRIGAMTNPAGYLFRVAQGRARRMRPRPVIVGPPASRVEEPWVEPGLDDALAVLSERQRVVVSLLHAFDWSMSEVAELLGVSKATVQSYDRRAMKKLQKALGVEV